MKRVLKVKFDEFVSDSEWLALKDKCGYFALLTESTGFDNIPSGKDCFHLDDYSSDSVASWCKFALLWLGLKVNLCLPNFGGREVWRLGVEFAGKNCLVIGSEGAIGKAVVREMKGSGLNVYGFDVVCDQDTEERLLYLLERVSVIVLCVPLNASTSNYLKPKHFSAMKLKPFIINPVRSPLVDLQLVEWGIRNNNISGYAMDEMPGGSLSGSNNCFFTPHIASRTKEAQKRKKKMIKEKLKEIYSQKPNRNLKQ